MMEPNEFWRTKLTPFDTELAIMVESLTGKPCELKNGGDNYFFEADYENHNDPNYILAMWDAIEGRTGERLLEIKDDAERHALFVRVKFSEQKYPGIIRASRDCSPQESFGKTYCHKLVEIRAVQVERDNAENVLRFVGNGEWEIPDDGPATFHFLNAAGSVFAHAPEHSYIVHAGPERFEIVDKKTFEKEYELR